MNEDEREEVRAYVMQRVEMLSEVNPLWFEAGRVARARAAQDRQPVKDVGRTADLSPSPLLQYLTALRDELSLGSDPSARAAMREFRDLGVAVDGVSLDLGEGGDTEAIDLVRAPALDRLLSQLDVFLRMLVEDEQGG